MPSVPSPGPPRPAADLALAADLFAALSLLRRHTQRIAGRPWQLGTVSEAQRELLRLVRRNPRTSVAEAAAELGLAANTVSTLVGQLTERGLMLRTPDHTDRRVGRLTLTPVARERVEAWWDRRSALVAAALRELSADERAALAGALPVLVHLSELIRPDPEASDPVASDPVAPGPASGESA